MHPSIVQAAIPVVVLALVCCPDTSTAQGPWQPKPPPDIKIPKPEVHLVIIRLQDSPESGGGSVADTAGLGSVVAYANRVYEGVGFKLIFDRQRDFVKLGSDELNRDSPDDVAATAAAAPYYPSRVPVFVRSKSNGGGWSSRTANHVMMPEFQKSGGCRGFNVALLAHELGHFFNLEHTFPGVVGDFGSSHCGFSGDAPRDAERWSCQDGRSPATAFDGDGLYDTAPDPGIEVFSACDPPASRDFECVHVRYTIRPPRDNIMSYYGSTMPTFVHLLSLGQKERVRIARIGRGIP